MMAEKKRRGPRVRKAPTVKELAKNKPVVERHSKLRYIVMPMVFIFRILFLNPVSLAIGKVLRWLTPRYFINSWKELKQVSWPNRRETWRLTGAVFIFATIFGAAVAGVDKGIDEIFKKLILK